MSGRKPKRQRTSSKSSSQSTSNASTKSSASPSSKPTASKNASPQNGSGPGAQEQVAAASVGMVLRLHRLPRWLLIVAPLATLLLGLLLPYAWAGIFILVLAVFFGWLVLLSWPRLPNGARVARIAVLLLLIAAPIAKFTSHV